MPDDRTILHTVHTDDGDTELYYARARDDTLIDWRGSLLFHKDGKITFKCWSDADEPFVTVIDGNRVTIAHSEDQPPDADAIIFDTDAYKPVT